MYHRSTKLPPSTTFIAQLQCAGYVGHKFSFMVTIDSYRRPQKPIKLAIGPLALPSIFHSGYPQCKPSLLSERPDSSSLSNGKQTFHAGDESGHGELDGPVAPPEAVAVVRSDGYGAAEGGADFIASGIQ